MVQLQAKPVRLWLLLSSVPHPSYWKHWLWPSTLHELFLLSLSSWHHRIPLKSNVSKWWQSFILTELRYFFLFSRLVKFIFLRMWDSGKKNFFPQEMPGRNLYMGAVYYNSSRLFWHNQEYFFHSYGSSTLIFICGSSLALLCGHQPWCPNSPSSKRSTIVSLMAAGCSLTMYMVELTGPLFRSIE